MAYDDLSYRSRPPAPGFEIPPLPSTPLTKSSSSLSRVQRRLRALSSSMVKTTSESLPEEDVHGAYGLNLLSEPSEPHLDFIFVSFLTIFLLYPLSAIHHVTCTDSNSPTSCSGPRTGWRFKKDMEQFIRVRHLLAKGMVAVRAGLQARSYPQLWIQLGLDQDPTEPSQHPRLCSGSVGRYV